VPRGTGSMASMSPATEPAPAPSHAEGPARVDDLLRRGREALAARRYVEARDLFDEALRLAPQDPRVQALAVTAEFWRRLAREGDGFGMPTAERPLSPRAKPKGPA